jgi:hypothetical protein
MKLDFRARTTYTITKVTEPMTLDSEKFRNVEPPFKGETEEEFYEYISTNLSNWEGEEFLENNKDKFTEEEEQDMWNTFIEYPSIEMFDSRYKSDEVVTDGGKIDKNYTRYAGFNPIYTPKYE